MSVVLTGVAALAAVATGCGGSADAPAGDKPATPAPVAAKPAQTQPTESFAAAARSRIIAAEYKVIAESDGKRLSASNRAARLRLQWRDGGATVQSSIPSTTASDGISLRALSVGRGTSQRALGQGNFALGKCRSDGAKDEKGECLRRIERTAGNVVESWENRPAGAEQVFVLGKRPPVVGVGKAGALGERIRVELQVKGARVEIDPSATAATFVATDASKQRFRYQKLLAFDAKGATMPARMVKTARGLALEVDDTSATYPLTIDPVLTALTPAATIESDQVGAMLDPAGTDLVVGAAGDVNGDGYDDVFVAFPFFNVGMSADVGQVSVYHGGPSGPDLTADWTSNGNGQAGSRFGRGAASAGDVNNDGFGDLIIGQPFYDNGQTDEGRIYVYNGSASGLVAAGSPSFTYESDQLTQALLGYSVDGAGDINGDGFDDIVVGMRGFDVNGFTSDEGRVLVFKGPLVQGTTAPSDTITGGITDLALGNTVAGAGDVNGDGRADIIISGNGPVSDGTAYIHLGNADGTITDTPAWTFTAGTGAALSAASGAGDVNGDGFADVVVGAYQANALSGAAYIFYGSAGALPTTPSVTLNGGLGGRFGRSVSGGDINGDGYSDVIVGAFREASDAGNAYVYLGGPSLPASINSANADQALLGDQAGAQFGSVVAHVGDVNGDGYGDMMVGAQFYTNGQTDEGRAYIYLGGPDSEGIQVPNRWSVESNVAGAKLGSALASADFNGDGYADVAAAAATGSVSIYNGSAVAPATTASGTLTVASVGFGASLAGGDVNGDGFDDLIVGAPQASNGEATEGRVYVYLGSSAGITSATVPTTFEPNVAGALLGTSVAAGDLNGDGRFEVIAGAPGFAAGQTGEGRVYVLLGGATGVNVAMPQTFENDTAGAAVGTAVASVGDVNGDGYGDLVAGAPGFGGGAGRIIVVFGSMTGIGLTNRTADGAAGSGFGSAVASVGDVTGDGFADIVVGSPAYANGQTAEGRITVLPGGAGAFGTAYNYEPNLANAALGSAVAGGDFNGDGLGDVAVGAPGEGNGSGTTKVFLAIAGGGGLPAMPNASVVEDTAANRWGSTLAAGDVNGDNVSDVITAGPNLANGQATEGRVNAYMGNRGGRPYRLRAQNAAGTLGAMRGSVVSGSLTSYRVAMTGISFRGRDSVKLEVEAKPVGTAFNGTSTLDATYSDTTTSGVALQQTFTGLTMGTAYHFRARVVSAEGQVQRKTPWFYGGVLGNPAAVAVRLDGPGLGIACTMNSQCGTGFCVDGVCCNSACGGGSTTDCQACSVAAGGASDGTCTSRTIGASCSDANLCNGAADTCQAGGVCAGNTPVVCTALDQCHDVGVCDTTTGTCSNPVKANGSTCNDGSACTSGETCQIGVCTPATTVTCAAPDQCHTAGICNATTGVCDFPAKADGTACNDTNACTATDTCVAGVCTGGAPVTCTASDQCHDVGICDTLTGQCSNPAKANGTTCNDGTTCTSNDVCTNGACMGAALNCNDNNACTTDTCVSGTGCVNTAILACNPDAGPGDAGTDAQDAGDGPVEPRPDADTGGVVEPRPDADTGGVVEPRTDGGTGGTAGGTGGTGAPSSDASSDVKTDAKTDVSQAVAGGGGCDCDVGPSRGGIPGHAILLVAMGLIWVRRQRRR